MLITKYNQSNIKIHPPINALKTEILKSKNKKRLYGSVVPMRHNLNL